MRSFGETLSNAATSPFTKFVEIDEWFDTRRNQLDILDGQLKSLLKSVEAVVKQRKGETRSLQIGLENQCRLIPLNLHSTA
jgi:hypothetical protein